MALSRMTILSVCAFVLAGCQFLEEDATYTLYRNSVLDPTMRIHVASFDTGEGEGYNAENCQVAADLFGRQPGIATRFWCEKGAFQP